MAFTNSPLAVYTRISPNKNTGRFVDYYADNPSQPITAITKITIHHMAGNLTVETCGRVFQPTSRKASSNYGIGTDG